MILKLLSSAVPFYLLVDSLNNYGRCRLFKAVPSYQGKIDFKRTILELSSSVCSIFSRCRCVCLQRETCRELFSVCAGVFVHVCSYLHVSVCVCQVHVLVCACVCCSRGGKCQFQCFIWRRLTVKEHKLQWDWQRSLFHSLSRTHTSLATSHHPLPPHILTKPLSLIHSPSFTFCSIVFVSPLLPPFVPVVIIIIASFSPLFKPFHLRPLYLLFSPISPLCHVIFIICLSDVMLTEAINKPVLTLASWS